MCPLDQSEMPPSGTQKEQDDASALMFYNMKLISVPILHLSPTHFTPPSQMRSTIKGQ